MYTPLHDWTVSLFSPVLLWSTQKFSVTLCLLPLLPNFVQFCILRKCFAVSCSVASVWCLCACGENHNDMVQKGLINNSCNQWAARVSDLKVTGYHSQNLAGNLRGLTMPVQLLLGGCSSHLTVHICVMPFDLSFVFCSFSWANAHNLKTSSLTSCWTTTSRLCNPMILWNQTSRLKDLVPILFKLH